MYALYNLSGFLLYLSITYIGSAIATAATEFNLIILMKKQTLTTLKPTAVLENAGTENT